MALRVAAVFRDQAAADRAAVALADLGADYEEISLLRATEDDAPVAPEAREDSRPAPVPTTEVGGQTPPQSEAREEQLAGTAGGESVAGEGVALGAAAGAVTGVAAGALTLLLSGAGPILAAGAAVAGTLGAGIAATLAYIGIEERAAHSYEQRMRSGEVLITALIPPDNRQQVFDALTEIGAEEVSFAEASPPDRTATAETE